MNISNIRNQKIKKIIGIIIIIFLVIIVFIGYMILFGKNISIEMPPFSTYSSNDEGLKAFYLLAEKCGYKTIRVKKEARFLKDSGIMISVNPYDNIFNSMYEISNLVKWVEKGNCFILVYSKENENTYIEFIDYIDSNENRVSETEFIVGDGKIYVYDDAVEILNKNLKNYNGAIKYINLFDSIGKKEILFNEYYCGNGQTTNFFDIIGENGEILVLQIVLAVIIFLYIKSVRFGKPVAVPEITKRVENEYIYAMSNIFSRAKLYSYVLNIYFHYFKKKISKYLGLSDLASEDELIDSLRKDSVMKKRDVDKLCVECQKLIKSNSKNLKLLFEIVSNMEKIRKELI